MRKTKTYIELNGAKYDATAGNFITPTVLSQPSTIKPSKKQVIDTIVQAPRVKSPSAMLSKKVTKRSNLHKPQPAHRKAQHSQTLMRHIVQKPRVPKLIHAKSASVARAVTSNQAVGHNVTTVKSTRIERALQTPKSSFVSKFNGGGLLVRKTPLTVTKSPNIASITIKESPSMLQKALADANSHTQPKVHKTRWHHNLAKRLHMQQRTFNVSAVFITALLVGSLFVYKNLPDLQVRLAAARAGLHASLPAYRPAGFSLKGPIHSGDGEVTVNFHSNSDARAFQVKQQASNWNSQTLLQAYVMKQQQPYQTFEDSGRIVYVNKDSANMMNGNKWIQVASYGALSAEQMLSIVKSIN